MAHLTVEEPQAQLQIAREQLEVGAKYRHYKSPDSHHLVKDVVLLEENNEPAVLYTPLYDDSGILWVRPIASWTEKVLNRDGIEFTRFESV